MDQYIPLDKSWINRMGILDIINGYDDITVFLNNKSGLSDDLLALKKASKNWKKDVPVEVGESGTLYRLLKFASWKLNLNKKFVLNGTLKNRKICDDPSIVHLSILDLLKLDNGTSQWASAAILLGNTEVIDNPPYKLKVTYDAVDHWNAMRKEGKVWESRLDETIENQAKAFLKLLKNEQADFTPEQAEDFCFAYTFGFITKEEGEKRWPSLRGHESDRIIEMESMLAKAKEGKDIDSKDHRVVQAIVMWGLVNKKEVKILYPDAVKKSWPQFWDFINWVKINT